MSAKPKLRHNPVVLIVLDGWGVSLPSSGNAISESKIPNFNSYCSHYPVATLQASGEATGLPWGESGNSEVGHMSIGAGRIIYQDLTRVNASISSKAFFSNQAFLRSFEHIRETQGVLHLIGIISTGGVHGHIEHLYALLELAHERGIKNVVVHGILDGRDTGYATAKTFIEGLVSYLEPINGVIGSLSGRFYAMDRDHHWDRVQKAYSAIVFGQNIEANMSPLEALDTSYSKNIYDEEFVPIAIANKENVRTSIESGDAIIFFNIRADRTRQLASSFLDPTFNQFKTKKLENIFFVTMTTYDALLPAVIAFPQLEIKKSLSEIISSHNLSQLHIAETEKYAHITYFLNDGREEPFPGEKRIMIPSPAVDSYDKKPEMSAFQITNEVVAALAKDEYDFYAINYANADLVGHTGNIAATIIAIQTLDACFRTLVPLVLQKNGAVLITADHGNAESLFDLKTGIIDKEHSNNPVPCIIIAKEYEGRAFSLCDVQNGDLSVLEPSGLLSDVAPTLLELMGIPQPSEMTGRSLLKELDT